MRYSTLFKREKMFKSIKNYEITKMSVQNTFGDISNS